MLGEDAIDANETSDHRDQDHQSQGEKHSNDIDDDYDLS